MVVICACPVILSFLLLAAHFLRGGPLVAVAPCLLAPLLLIPKRRWADLIVQGLLITGTGIWVATALSIVEKRHTLGQPAFRSALILSAVAAFTLVSALVFYLPPMRRRYTDAPRHESEPEGEPLP